MARGKHIRFVLMVVQCSCKVTIEEMATFLGTILPQFYAQPDGSGKVGLLWQEHPVHFADLPALAMQAFGAEFSDTNRYITVDSERRF